jgi:Acetyl-CoA dehydrogenase C-terminal like
VTMNGGAALKMLAERILGSIERAKRDASLAQPAAELTVAWQALIGATYSAWASGQPEDALANATPYMQAFGHTVLAWLWLDVALACVGRGDGQAQGRRAAMRYFFAYELPKTAAWLAVAASRNPTCRDMHDDWF